MLILIYHNQISLLILRSDYGQFNDLGILQCEKEEKLNELLRKNVSKSFSALLRCVIKVFMDSSNVKFVIDPTLRVSSITNFIIGLVHEYIE